MLSRSSGYALLAMGYLAAQPSGRLAGARDLAGGTGIPVSFLWKILRNLARRKLVRSFRGVHGGYELARSAERICLLEVVEATQRGGLFSRCTLGFAECNHRHLCPLDAACKDIRRAVQATFERMTVADLAVHVSHSKSR